MTAEDVVNAVAASLFFSAVGFLLVLGVVGFGQWLEERRRERDCRVAEAYAWTYGLRRRRGETVGELCGRIVRVIERRRDV